MWENLHSLLYAGYRGGAITELILLRASVADAVIITLIALPFVLWPRLEKNSWVIVIIGVLISIGIEWFALGTDRWAYNDLMPLVPILDVGLTPTIQLGLLGYLAYWTVVKKRKLAVPLLLLFVVLLMPFIIVRVPQESIVSLSEATPTDVAIIFGAGLKRDGTPSDALMDRFVSPQSCIDWGK